MNGTALHKPTARRVVGMVAGIVIIALGIALFKQSHLGNDSISALNMRLAELLGISLGTQNLCTNLLFFLLEFWFGRKYIGLGTFVNGICIGYIVTAFYDPIHSHFGDAPSLAVPVTARGASRSQTADLGIAPYDYLSLGLRDYTPVPYFGCRVFTDALCALLCWLLGGLVGIGTLICAFCLGPFIQFFNGLVSERVLHYKPGGQEDREIKKACTSFVEVHAFCCAEIRTRTAGGRPGCRPLPASSARPDRRRWSR